MPAMSEVRHRGPLLLLEERELDGAARDQGLNRRGGRGHVADDETAVGQMLVGHGLLEPRLLRE